ncbi:F-box domain, cyclin-like protein, partial [Metarhizium majus ARSEF 297]
MAVEQLGDWPSELILSLLDLLPLPDLLYMGRVNKYTRNVAEPLVYSTIETIWALRGTPPAMLLLPTIFDRPDLAGHVRTLRLQGDGFENHPEVREPPAFPASPLLLDKATKFIQSTWVPFAKSWIGELQLGTVDAIVAALLASMPNLTTLYLGPNFTIRSCQPKEYHLPTFTQLRHVTSEYRAKEWHHRNITNTADVLPFFYLPNVEHLSVSIDNPVQFA